MLQYVPATHDVKNIPESQEAEKQIHVSIAKREKLDVQDGIPDCTTTKN